MGFVLTIDSSACTACRMCEMACSLRNSNECNPERSRIRVVIAEKDGRINVVPSTCMQCETAMCMLVCPNQAIQRNSATGALAVEERKCVGCSACGYACPFGACFVDRKLGKTVVCNQCDGDPTCVKICPTNALSYVHSDKINIGLKRDKAFRLLAVNNLLEVDKTKAK